MPVIEMTQTIKASPETIWRLLTEPDQLMRWFPSRAEAELAVGGQYTYWFDHTSEERGCDITRGQYTVVEPFTRLVHTWSFETGERSVESTVEWTLSPEGDSTVLTLRHSGFDDGEVGRKEAEEHTKGWEWFIGNLKGQMEGADDVRAGAGMVVERPA